MIAVDPAAVDVVREATGVAIARAAIDRARAWRARRLRCWPALPFALPGAAARAWLSQAVGVDFETHPCRQLGVSAGRVDLRADGTFDWLPQARSADELAGTRVVLIPADGEVFAIDPARRARQWSLKGWGAEPLGWGEATIALDSCARAGAQAAIVVASDPLAWLRLVVRDGVGEPGLRARDACHACLGDMPAIAVLDWQGPEVDELLRHPNAMLVAEDEAGAAALHRRVKAWRRAHTPPQPRIGVYAPAPAHGAA